MSSGYSPCHITKISMENVEKLCPGAYVRFWVVMETHDIDARWAFEEFLTQNDDCPPQPTEEEFTAMTELWEAWEKLQEDFARVTKVANGSHLDLFTGYYDSENGDCYDEIEDGPFFCVEGAFVRSQAGETFKDMLEDTFYVNFG